MKEFLREERAQALVEYILMLAMVMTLITAIGVGFRRALMRLWNFYAKKISAPCPSCPADTAIGFR